MTNEQNAPDSAMHIETLEFMLKAARLLNTERAAISAAIKLFAAPKPAAPREGVTISHEFAAQILQVLATGECASANADLHGTLKLAMRIATHPGHKHAQEVCDPRHDSVIERAAKAIYDAMPYDGKSATGSKPEWVPHGNSVRQDEARAIARRDREAMFPTPIDSEAK